MRYTVKTLREKSVVTDYTVDGDSEDLTRAVRELEGRGEEIVTTRDEHLTMDGRPYKGSVRGDGGWRQR